MEILVSIFAVAVGLSCLVVLVISGVKDRRQKQAADQTGVRSRRKENDG
jgi:hypothetical protein